MTDSRYRYSNRQASLPKQPQQPQPQQQEPQQQQPQQQQPPPPQTEQDSLFAQYLNPNKEAAPTAEVTAESEVTGKNFIKSFLNDTFAQI